MSTDPLVKKAQSGHQEPPEPPDLQDTQENVTGARQAPQAFQASTGFQAKMAKPVNQEHPVDQASTATMFEATEVQMAKKEKKESEDDREVAAEWETEVNQELRVKWGCSVISGFLGLGGATVIPVLKALKVKPVRSEARVSPVFQVKLGVLG